MEKDKMSKKRSLKHTVILLISISLFFGLSGCRSGPDSEQLSRDIQQKLDENFGENIFKVDSVARRGSYSYSEEGDSRQYLLVYYNADIRFLKAYKLSQWDQPNVGSLISVLGATGKGVNGVNPEGNQPEDSLLIHGAFAYVSDNDAWSPALRAKSEGQKAVRPGSEELPPYRKRMEKLAKIGKLFQRGNRQAEIKLLEHDLDRVISAAQRRLAKSKGILTIATGTSTGEYYALGKNLEKLINPEAQSVSTSGSEENCQLVESREVDFAFSQNDIAHMAYNGTDLFDRFVPQKNLRAVCTLYPEAVQIVTLKSSGFNSLADLRGKKINIGLKGSGVRINALQVLKASGMKLSDFGEIFGTNREQALEQLKQKQVDAFFLTGSYPISELLDLAADQPIHLIPIEEAVVEELTKTYSFFLPLQIAKSTYPEMEESVRTVAVTAMVITHKNAREEKVQNFIKTLYSDVKTLSTGAIPAYYISPEKAKVGLSIPQHPAAKRFFEKNR